MSEVVIPDREAPCEELRGQRTFLKKYSDPSIAGIVSYMPEWRLYE